MISLKTKENPYKVLPTQAEKEEWNRALRRIARVEQYRQLKDQHSKVCQRIFKLDGGIEPIKNPKKPSEDVMLRHLQLSHRVLSKLKPNLEHRMEELEKVIKEDIEQSKQEK
jgi:hypothetical protein